MKAYNQLVSFADENRLKLWTKDIIPELGDIVIVTDLNRICASFYNYGIDDVKDLKILDNVKRFDKINHPIIIGNHNIYLIEYFKIGFKIHTYSDSSDILSFLTQLIKSNKNRCALYDSNINEWIECWKLIYELIKRNIDINNVEQIFKTELFNSSFVNSAEEGLFNSGLKKVYLKLKYPNYRGEYTINLFFDLNEGKDNDYFLDFNLKVEYSEGDSYYGYKFYYSNNYPQKYTYPNSPKDFKNIFNHDIKNCKIIDTLFFWGDSFEQPLSLDVLNNY